MQTVFLYLQCVVIVPLTFAVIHGCSTSGRNHLVHAKNCQKGRTGTFGEIFCAIKAGRWNVSGWSELNINGKSIKGDDKAEWKLKKQKRSCFDVVGLLSVHRSRSFEFITSRRRNPARPISSWLHDKLSRLFHSFPLFLSFMLSFSLLFPLLLSRLLLHSFYSSFLLHGLIKKSKFHTWDTKY